MTKLVLDDIGSTLTNTAATTINNNNNKIEQALENTLSRDGSTPNNMSADIDMDNNDLLNVNQINVERIVLNGAVLQTVTFQDALSSSNNLSDVQNVVASRANLGLGSIATRSGSDYRFITTVANAPSVVIPTGAQKVFLEDRFSHYVPVASEPSHTFKFLNGSQWWEIDEPIFDVRMAGIVLDSLSSAAANKAAFDLIQAYMISKGGGEIFVPKGTIYTAGRWTIPSFTTIRGSGIGVTRVLGTTSDRVFFLEDDSGIFDITADAQDLQPSTGSVILSRDRTILRNVEAKNGYTGFSWGEDPEQYGSQGSSLRSIGMVSRGFQLDPFAHLNQLTDLYAEDCGNAGILIAHGSYENTVKGVTTKQIGNPSVWIHEGAHDNIVEGVVLTNPVSSGMVAISIDQGCYRNRVSNGVVSGHGRVAQFIGGFVDGVYPAILDHETEENIVEGIISVGVNNTTNTHDAIVFQQTTGTSPTANRNVVRNCSFDTFYSVFRNVSDAANNCDLSDIKTRNIGAGTVMGRMKSSTDSVRLRNIQGFPTTFRATTSAFAVDSTGEKTLVVSHGLGFTPPISAMTLTLVRNTVVNDFEVGRYGLWVPAVTGTDITARTYITTASATGGATANLAIMVDVLAENGFACSSLP